MSAQEPLLVEGGQLREFRPTDQLFAEGGFINGNNQHKFTTSAIYQSVIGGAATGESFLIGSAGTMQSPDIITIKGFVEIFVSGSPIYIYKIEYTATIRTDAVGDVVCSIQQNKTVAKGANLFFNLLIYKDTSDNTYKIVCARTGTNVDAIFTVTHQHEVKRRYSTLVLWENAANAAKITIPAQWQLVTVNSRGVDKVILADRLLVGASDSVFSGNEPFQVNGTIRATSGGFMFPDGSLQTTAYTGGAGGSGVDIGETILLSDMGNKINNDTKEYLRSGFFESAAQYPIAAQREHLKVVGNTATNATAYLATDIADNGSNIIVVAIGMANILVSTNGGMTWSYVASNLQGGIAATTVIYTGSRFIIAGNDSTSIRASYTLDGVTFTSAGSGGTGTYTANTCRMAWNGTIAMAVAQGGSSAVTTTDGVTLTNKPIGSLGAQPSIAAKGSTFLFGGGTGTLYSTTDGNTITNRALGGTAASNGKAIGSTANGWLVMSNTAGTYFFSTDLSSWTPRQLPYAISTKNVLSACFITTSPSGKCFIGAAAAPQIWYTTDGAVVKTRSLTASTAASTAWFASPNGKVFVRAGSTAGSNILYTSDFDTADFVGIVPEALGNGTANVSSQVLYVRVS